MRVPEDSASGAPTGLEPLQEVACIMKMSALHQQIKRLPCFPRGARILVAVSGGADSVALLHLLHDLAPSMQWELGVAHLNHKLRGREADQDEWFVRNLARSLKCPCYVRRKNVSLLARRAGVSVEMQARTVRYAFLSDMARAKRYVVAALAHTMDDQAETVLLRLLRGAGTAGLGGMEPVTERNGLRVARPLLRVPKTTLIRWLEKRDIAWREDVTNRDAVYLRNRVRHELIPLLRDRFNPNLPETLARTAELLRDDDAVLCALAETDRTACARSEHREELDARRLAALPPARRRRVVLQWLIEAGVDETHLRADTVERVCALCRTCRGSAEASVQETVRVMRRYDRLMVLHGRARSSTGLPGRIKLAVPGVTSIPEMGLRVTTAWTAGYIKSVGERCGQLPVDGYVSAAALVRAALYLRFWRAGDRFSPLGMTGEKKVQDIFVDEKVPREHRARIPLLECRKRLVWIPGYRVAKDWAVRGAADRALQVRIEAIPE